jgi:hypothetical protein
MFEKKEHHCQKPKVSQKTKDALAIRFERETDRPWTHTISIRPGLYTTRPVVRVAKTIVVLSTLDSSTVQAVCLYHFGPNNLRDLMTATVGHEVS